MKLIIFIIVRLCIWFKLCLPKWVRLYIYKRMLLFYKELIKYDHYGMCFYFRDKYLLLLSMCILFPELRFKRKQAAKMYEHMVDSDYMFNLWWFKDNAERCNWLKTVIYKLEHNFPI